MSSRKGIWASFRDFVYTDLFPQKMGNDIVSSNAKVVLYGLFALVGFAILTYSFTVTGDKYQIESEVEDKPGNTLNDAQKVERFEQLEQINSVYIAAISGSLALGGTLIARLWGRG